ncbi:MAG: 30S ribosomal protein S4 [Spirochaetales bacterium]
MATKRNPRFKECRKLGVNACGHPKAMKRVAATPKRRRKVSEYGLQLNEKQKVKAYYGIFEKQLRNYYAKAKKRTEMRTGDALLIMLEQRLDNMVYRIGFANSIRMARQVVSHGHICVNDKKIDIPSYIVQPNDVITLREKSRGVEGFKTNFLKQNSADLPYIERSEEGLSGKLTRSPTRSEIPVMINDQLVVEFYSR